LHGLSRGSGKSVRGNGDAENAGCENDKPVARHETAGQEIVTYFNVMLRK